jgi:hypothetical protein
MLRIGRGDIHLIDLETRLPFKYGIATMTRAPYAFVRVPITVDGVETCGIAADLLPPKWFTKVPEALLEDEVAEMLAVIEQARDLATGLEAETVFDAWRELSRRQSDWGRDQQLPPLLTQFGTSLIERALIEAVCRVNQQSFAEAVRENTFGIQLGEFDERLAGTEPADWLPTQPRTRIIARHTIGMADPLTDADIVESERLDDGLPQSLTACIARYGLQHYKIKVSGDFESDIGRVSRIAEIFIDHATPDFAFTMDGNEQFRTLESFRSYWERLTVVVELQSLFKHLLFVEQPFHRDIALDADVLGELSSWTTRPRMIIDESDADANSLRQALSLGYHGTSHKNCKGVFKSILSACLLSQLNRDDPQAGYVMSGEDLANVGPVALLQDLATTVTLGITSVERNGHHYFAGLSAFPAAVQQQTLRHHADLYHPSESGWPTLNIEQGEIDVTSVTAAPFGVGFEVDAEQFKTVDQWRSVDK